MKRQIARSEAFVRAAKRLIKKQPHLAEVLQKTIVLLAEDAFHPTLKTHKLKGDLSGSWSCTLSYDLRIVFEFVQMNSAEGILLQSIGTHDEVY